ncbi:hypothetical protein VSR01_17110 [Actinacidiphila sp. DG2A-62]|uniref:hypothetical protein n=1 Tax=Actinacidiphila sp. DG2A-62 TaxID=3108821 RepID=UPI002DB9996B|nr:hypothetical protein [Actinacidiphila sp. DG2A-62]MEC3995158.1 hypothetical protein [Actinacidiphila sp. DG2A-62]
MTTRYFRDQDGGVQQHGNLTEEGAAVLLNAGHEEITAEEWAEVQTAAAEAARTAAVPQTGGEQPKEASRGRNGRERRR